MTIRKLLTLLAAMCVLVPGTTAVLARASDTPVADAIPLRSDELSDLSADVSILRDPSETDGPVTAEDVQGAPILPNDVIALSDARQVADSDLLIAPTKDGTGVCVAGPGRMACGNADQLTEQGASPAVTWDAEGEVHLIGLASDDVTTVTVVYSDGTEQEVDTSANVLDTVLRDRPVAIRWDGPQGVERMDMPANVDVP